MREQLDNMQLQLNAGKNATATPVVQHLDQSEFTVKIAAGRFKSIEPQNCLSCGEFEAKEVQNRGLIGLHTKNAS